MNCHQSCYDGFIYLFGFANFKLWVVEDSLSSLMFCILNKDGHFHPLDKDPVLSRSIVIVDFAEKGSPLWIKVFSWESKTAIRTVTLLVFDLAIVLFSIVEYFILSIGNYEGVRT